jgi:hypothetical protein
MFVSAIRIHNTLKENHEMTRKNKKNENKEEEENEMEKLVKE